MTSDERYDRMTELEGRALQKAGYGCAIKLLEAADEPLIESCNGRDVGMFSHAIEGLTQFALLEAGLYEEWNNLLMGDIDE